MADSFRCIVEKRLFETVVTLEHLLLTNSLRPLPNGKLAKISSQVENYPLIFGPTEKKDKPIASAKYYAIFFHSQ